VQDNADPVTKQLTREHGRPTIEATPFSMNGHVAHEAAFVSPNTADRVVPNVCGVDGCDPHADTGVGFSG